MGNSVSQLSKKEWIRKKLQNIWPQLMEGMT
uniref:Uncharacterized protein n=1 Tax=Rhizophora mucronata TaxID=61149 RepID=A0A2P2PZA9_RHIMU